MSEQKDKKEEDKTIQELAAGINKADPEKTTDPEMDKIKINPEKEKLRSAVLKFIEKEKNNKAEQKARQDADRRTFDKREKSGEVKKNLEDKLTNFYQGLASHLKDFHKNLSSPKKDKIDDDEKSTDKKSPKTKKSEQEKPAEEKSRQPEIVKDSKKTKEQKTPFRQSLALFFLNLLITLVLLSGLAITLVGVAIYQNSFFSNTTRTEIINLIPYPAGMVNNHFLSIAEFRSDVAALNRFYAVQIDSGVFGEIPESTNIQDIVWERFVQNSLIQDLADDLNVSVDKEEIETELEQIVLDSGGMENLTKQLAFLYGWEVDIFSEKIVKPFILREKIAATVFYDIDLRQKKKDYAQSILEKVRADLDNFADYAQQYSQDETSKKVGGDLGFFVEGVVVPEIENALRDMDVGEVSEVLETNEGFEILLLEDKFTGDNERLNFKARRILIRYPTFEELLSDMRKEAKIYRFIY